uniref:Uncharacterized protein n=1 Tax=Triticum urartu TaxID=4572 RepID=A0A8R7Q8X4_TRIUA
MSKSSWLPKPCWVYSHFIHSSAKQNLQLRRSGLQGIN